MQVEFKNDLVVVFGHDGLWKLDEPLVVEVDRRGWVIPAGFATDFASVPRIFHNIISPTGNHGRAAVLHDFFYYAGETSRYMADRIFSSAMVAENVNSLKASIIFFAVRLGGFGAWQNHRRQGHNLKMLYSEV